VYHQLLGFSSTGGQEYIFAGATLGGQFSALPVEGQGMIFNVPYMGPRKMTDFVILHEIGHVNGLRTEGHMATEWQANKYAIEAMKRLGEWSH